MLLCPHCHRIVSAEAAACRICGEPLDGPSRVLALVLDDGRRVPLGATVTIGRGEGNDLRLDDPALSRRHARVLVEWDGDERRTLIEDVGSTYGTTVDGEPVEAALPLEPGARIKLGDTQLRVAEHDGEAAAAGPPETLHIGAASAAVKRQSDPARASDELHPRARAGLALKRLSERGRRHAVIRDERSGSFLRISIEDADLFELLDGGRTLAELLAEAESRFGAEGPSRLARLLADLGDRGMLEGVRGADRSPPGGALVRLLRPRERLVQDPDLAFEELYERGGWRLFTDWSLVALAAVGLTGIVAFALLIANRYGTPFVVADRVGIGALIFLVGRFGLVAAHEFAHGLAMAAVGRTVHRAGAKLVAIFPFAFVDTSEAWFEPRRRRLVVASAGPASDLVIGALFALACLALPAGAVRDIGFQLALAGYVAAFFNLNPFLDRDGYHILVDVLDEPGLRRRSQAALIARLSGRSPPPDSRGVLLRYALAGLAWSVVTVGLVAVLTLQYYDQLTALVPEEAVLAFVVALYALLLLPIVLTVALPVLRRLRGASRTGGNVVG
ncbi:MAG TPA: FHA domain-containing protein [Solirubrobacterales bacterium]|nr:FHA domain-containing protein [Solirubrobacterales bacterium]